MWCFFPPRNLLNFCQDLLTWGLKAKGLRDKNSFLDLYSSWLDATKFLMWKIQTIWVRRGSRSRNAVCNSAKKKKTETRFVNVVEDILSYSGPSGYTTIESVIEVIILLCPKTPHVTLSLWKTYDFLVYKIQYNDRHSQISSIK